MGTILKLFAAVALLHGDPTTRILSVYLPFHPHTKNDLKQISLHHSYTITKGLRQYHEAFCKQTFAAAAHTHTLRSKQASETH